MMNKFFQWVGLAVIITPVGLTFSYYLSHAIGKFNVDHVAAIAAIASSIAAVASSWIAVFSLNQDRHNRKREDLRFEMDRELLWHENASWLNDFCGTHIGGVDGDAFKSIETFAMKWLSPSSNRRFDPLSDFEPRDKAMVKLIEGEITVAGYKLAQIESLILTGILSKNPVPESLKSKLQIVERDFKELSAVMSIKDLVGALTANLGEKADLNEGGDFNVGKLYGRALGSLHELRTEMKIYYTQQ